MSDYPEPEFAMGHVVYNRFDEPLTVVAQRRTDQIMAWGDRRLFSDEAAKAIPWFYTLCDSRGHETSISEPGLRHQEKAVATLQTPNQTERSPIPPTQRGSLTLGERLRNPCGTWTVSESWVANKAGAQGKDRKHGPASVSGDNHMYYLLAHEDGHHQEWSAPDMADAGFHRILPDEQQTLPRGEIT
ncbi:hypothetical protein [Streptomyces caniscabiei]|uniref:hypothetical protein n=1 Tax=Streptomyces caniscabiei TaxID=2746961 RepID=UPI0007659B48|nr:hypothetical protein [Streptomyces caniscabiei]